MDTSQDSIGSVEIKPNVRTYTALVTALGNGRQWKEAFLLIQQMRSNSGFNGVEPNAYTYSALLKAMGEQVSSFPLAFP